MQDPDSRWLANVYRVLFYGPIQFVVLTAIAMLLYPGGTFNDPTTEHYDFFRNFFSDLGITETYGGYVNSTSSALFLIALTLGGMSLIVFYVLTPILLRDSRLALAFALIGSFFGVLTGVGFIGVAMTPADVMLDAHIQFVFYAFVSFTIAAAFYTVAIFRTSFFSQWYAALYVGFVLILAAYLWLLFGGGGSNDPEINLVIQATGQKIVVYASIITLFINIWGVRKKLDEPAGLPKPS